SRGKLTAAVTLETGKALEVCFEVCGPKVFAAGITPAKWVFPGLSIRVEANAPEPLVRERDGCVEIVYPYRPGFTGKHMDFKLELQSGD
ncbi:MAG: hypothetical protein E6Z15_29685, partial [Paenibacillus macerans]|nr:hypothetical protein [Paenibacillus macerans]